MSDAATIIFVTLFFVFGLPIIFLIFYFAKVHKPLEKAKIETPMDVTVREIVMVHCKYCHGLMPTTAIQYRHCRAPRRQ